MKSKIWIEELPPNKIGENKGMPRFKVHWRQATKRGGRKRKRAKTYYHKWEAKNRKYELDKAADNPVNDYKINDLIAEYRNDEMNLMHDTTRTDYEFIIEKYIEPELGNYLIEELTPADVQQLMQQCATQPLEGRTKPGGKTTANKIRMVLNMLYRGAAMRDWTTRNPAKDPKRLKTADRPMNPFSLDDLSKIFITIERMANENSVYATMRPIVALAASTGLRQGELMGLRWRNISINEQMVQVRQQWTRGREGPLKTRKSRRAVPFRRDVGVQLAEHHKSMEKAGHPTGIDDWVFPDTRKHSDDPRIPFTATTLIYRFRKILDRAGFASKDYRFHDLRSTFAINALDAGLALNVVQILLGHKTPIMTLRYAQFLKDQTAAEKLRSISERMLPESKHDAQMYSIGVPKRA